MINTSFKSDLRWFEWVVGRKQDFEFENGVKKVEIINKLPYILNKKTNKKILFNCLHFQGGAKNYIKQIYDRTH